jgi:hypothetical protein
MRRKKFTYPVSTIAGSTPGNIIQILKRHKADRAYYFKTALSLLVSLIFSFFNLIENLIWGRRIKNFQVKEPPVFIIGFNRSGTTLLHNLLCQDPKAGYTTTFQTVFPHCVLTQKWWLGPFINSLVPSKRPFDDMPMDMTFPQEEEFALANLQPFSVYHFFLFPADFDRFVDVDYVTGELPEDDLRRWKSEYRRLVAKSLLNTKGNRYVSKNPHNIPRIDILKEMYPGCKFIFIYRDPYVVVESLYHFILGIFPGVQLQHVPGTFTRKNVARFYSIAMNHYFDHKDKDSSLQVTEIRMEDFLKDKTGSLKDIYTSLNLEGFDQSLPAFESYLGQNHNSHNNAYDIPEETIEYVNEYAREIVVRLGYPLRNNG